LKEAELHQIWARQSWIDWSKPLKTAEGHELFIYTPGELNYGQGPDFYYSRIEINRLQWIGSIEIHKKPEEWYQHSHHTDPVYNSTILHVSLPSDAYTPLYRQDGTLLPQLFITPDKLRNALSRNNLLCQTRIAEVPDELKKQAIRESLEKRIGIKIEYFKNLYHKYTGDFDHIFFTGLVTSMVGPVNKIPAEVLSSALNFRKFQSSEIPQELLQEVFQKYFSGKSFSESASENLIFNKTLPKNFLETIYKKTPGGSSTFASRWSQALTLFYLKEFRDVWKFPELWDVWFKNQNLKNGCRIISEELWIRIIANCFVPLYGLWMELKGVNNAGLTTILDRYPSEKNRTIAFLSDYFDKPSRLSDSQGMLGLYKELCTGKNCKNCTIGKNVFNLK
jgi:hypothetical protein